MSTLHQVSVNLPADILGGDEAARAFHASAALPSSSSPGGGNDADADSGWIQTDPRYCLRAAQRLTHKLAQRRKRFGPLYKAVLSRGYAIVRNAQDEPVRSAAALARGDALTIQFGEGDERVRATVGEGASADAPRRKASPKADQGSLF